MSLATITLVRQCPVINSFVQLENNNPSGKTVVPLAFIIATNGVVNRLSQTSGMGRNGGKFGPQEWVEFEEGLGQSNPALEYVKTLFHTNVRTDQKMPWEV